MASDAADSAVRVDRLVRTYGSGFRAVDGISFEIRPGEIFGLIGPNGAGKTTAIRVLATLLRPTSGTVTVFGHDVVREQRQVRREISYLPEDAGAYENLSGREYLEFMAAFYEGDSKAMVDLGLRIASLGPRIDSKVKEYSKGMRRRLLIGRAMMTSPRLAIMDEATSGLDVMHAQHVRKQIRDVVNRNRSTALVSSHNLLEVEFLCDRVALMDHGRLLEVGSPTELKTRHNASNLEQVFVEAVAHA